MNRKTISKLISKKFNEWKESITDLNVKKLVEDNTIITGGCITSMFLNEDVNDYDIYFTDKKTTKAVALYYVGKFNETYGANENILKFKHEAIVIDGAESIEQQVADAGERMWDTKMLEEIPEDRIKIIVRSDGVASDPDHKKAIEEADEITEAVFHDDIETDELKGKYRPVFLSTNAITLSNKIQIVIRFHGDAEEIHKNFDFVHCMNYWASKDKSLSTKIESLEAILAKSLVYHGSRYPLCSIIRTRKFLKRGWNINAGQYLKMCFQLSELDLSDINVLEEQLVGGDTIYFMQLVESLKSKKENDPNFKVSTGYITTIIDKLF